MKNKRLQSRFTAKRSEVVLTAVLAAVIATGVSAQERPNFTGAWRVSESAAGSAGGEEQTVSLGSGWGESFTLVHASDLLTVERVLYRPRDYQPTMRLRYALDGTESKNTILMGRGLQIQVSIATWESDKLVITTVHTVPDVEDEGTISCEVTRTLSLQLPQQAVGESSLVVETNRCGVLGGLPSSTRTVYNRN